MITYFVTHLVKVVPEDIGGWFRAISNGTRQINGTSSIDV